MSSAVSVLGGYIFRIMNSTGFVTDGNRMVLWLADILIMFMLAGKLLQLILRQIFGQKTEKLINAMKKISDGEFDIKLYGGKKLTDPGQNTVETFNDMATQLRSNAELNRDFAGNFSHEIKTPLGTINGFAKILKDNSLSEEEKLEYLNIIIDESDRLSILSNNILLLSRIEKQTDPVSMAEFNLTEQIRQTAALMYHKWNEKNIEIIIEGEDVTVSANRELMAQVWINLLDNAIKFSPVNEAIYIKVEKNADRITVSIKNHGHTLSKDEIPHIFDKFYQGTGEKKNLGNGLGLAMVRKITELHRGFVSAELLDDDTIQININLPACQ